MKQGNGLHEENGCSIGVIGGADGPTAIFLSHSSGNPRVENKWLQILEACKKLVVPKNHAITGDELKQYLIAEYDAQEIEVSKGQRLSLKINVLLNYHPEALQQPAMPQQDADKETWLKWVNQKHTDYWHSAQLVPDEKYGLRFACLNVPRTPKTERFYLILEQERRDNIRKQQSLRSKLLGKYSKEFEEEVDDMEFELELSTGYMQLRNGCSLLMNEIILWRGVTQEDIDNCTPVFISYAAAMRDTGKIHL